MKKAIVLFFIYNICFSQGEANIWYFGNKAGIDFNSGVPIDLSNGEINTTEGCATICNNAGQLLFYTDGISVWTRDHELMPNGNNLMGHPSSTQSAIIVPKPNSNNIYYIFTTPAVANSNGLRFSEVDMNLNGGFGDITNNKNILLATPVCEKLCAVKNSSGDGYWVVTHKFGDNTFLSFSVDSNGVNTNPVTTAIGTVITNDSGFNTYRAQGHLKFSPDGTKLVCLNLFDDVQLFDFDSETGMVSNELTLNTSYYILCYGAEFSQSGNRLYVSASFYQGIINSIIQYDLTAVDIPSSEIIIADEEPFSFGSLQLATDGKIYCSGTFYASGHHYLSVINNPEELGADCQFVMNQVLLTGKSLLGLPQSIQSIFEIAIICESNCDLSSSFHLNSSQNITSALWDFGDGSTSTISAPQHSYNAPGNYLVTVTAVTANGSIFSENLEIEIIAAPVANTINPVTLCSSNNSAYDLTQNNFLVAGNQSLQIYRVSYFSSITDAINHSNVLSYTQIIPLGQHTFYAKIYNINNFNCYDITPITIIVNEKPILKPNLELIECDSFPYDNTEVFDLSTISSNIIENSNTSIFSVTYHLTLPDAQNNTNPIPLYYSNSSLLETLYVRVENNNDSSCFSIETLTLKISREPQIVFISNYIICNNNETNPDTANFDLTSKNTEILNGQSPSEFSINYYLSASDAQNNTNPLASNYTNNANPQTIFVRISNSQNSDCFTITSFDLKVLEKPDFNIDPIYTFCEGNSPITIALPSSFSYYYWSTGALTSSIVISLAGDYSVTVSHDEGNLLCQTTKTFSVITSNVATVMSIETVDFNNDDNIITVNASGLGEYEYSLDGVTYQDSNSFEHLDGGEYQIFVRDKNGCGVIQESTYLLTYPKYFTPNNDGYNDYWKIKFSHLEPNLEIKILDRYGKLIKVLNNNSNGWDGKLNGNELLSDDYWFVINRENGKVYRGHFSLIR